MGINLKTLARLACLALAVALGAFALAGCGAKSPIHDQIETAKANIASGDKSKVVEGWTYLGQNKDDSEAKTVIDSLGGLPTPYTNLYQLWLMAGKGDLTLMQEADDKQEDAIEGYFEEALGLGKTKVEKVEALDPSSDSLKQATDELFGQDVITQIRANSWFYLDSNNRYPTNFKTQVQNVPEIRSESEAIALLDKITDKAGLGTKSAQGGVDSGLWYTHGKKESADWFAVYYWSVNSNGEEAPVIQVWLSDCFSSRAESGLKGYDHTNDFEVEDALFSGHQEGSSAASSSSSASSSPSSASSTQSVAKDEKITETDGKTVWKVQAASSTIHFTGSFTGQGNFIVELQDGNQNLKELVCNEIGDHKLDKSVSVTKGSTYYIQVECSRGSWNLSWTGTGGN